ncbi:hypothetical protein K5Z09_004379 [Escherichia coli]|nr:hypothetical protein [Escherichia coli]EHR9097598.1 hypothetical protein [Escherichia coli]EIM2919102.1 hypothetical protein [Escherichia coli]EIM2935063.1 hypothetical protein [Escherichia coli]EIM2940870.1 hypothetical protein [Escherichia coli]
MPIDKTHTGLIITSNGKKRVRMHETGRSWVVSQHECYDKVTGLRFGDSNLSGRSRRLILDSIEPITETKINEAGKLFNNVIS